VHSRDIEVRKKEAAISEICISIVVVEGGLITDVDELTMVM
jgi:hypothetical protein